MLLLLLMIRFADWHAYLWVPRYFVFVRFINESCRKEVGLNFVFGEFRCDNDVIAQRGLHAGENFRVTGGRVSWEACPAMRNWGSKSALL